MLQKIISIDNLYTILPIKCMIIFFEERTNEAEFTKKEACYLLLNAEIEFAHILFAFLVFLFESALVFSKVP